MNQQGSEPAKEEEVEQPQPVNQQPEYYPPIQQEYQHKIFINNCNTYIGSQLVEIFRNDDEIEVNPNIIIGSVDESVKYHGELGVNTVIDCSNKRLLNSVLKESDFIVYVLNDANHQQFEYICKIIRKIRADKDSPLTKKLILISSCVTWNSRRGSLQVQPSSTNLFSRNSTKTHLVQLQNLCLDINNYNCGVQTFVVCAGLVYGLGQGILFPYFKKALEQSQPLKIYGKGTNKIPMIHLTDLCEFVKKIAFQKLDINRQKVKLPLKNYYFAVDSSCITQKQLICGIAQTLGNGSTEQIPIQNAFLCDNFDQMTIDMKVQDVCQLKQWKSKEGIISTFSQIVSQFNVYRGLKPNKIVIFGPPAVGKSKVASALCNAYGLPILTISKVIEDIKNQEGEFAQSIKVKIEEIRTTQVQEERKAFEDAKKKKKGKKDGGEEFDPSKVIPRLPEDDLMSVFRHRLNKSDCQNKGFILDGWPKTVKSCKILFENENSQIIQNLFPNSCFKLEGSEEEIKQRVKNLPNDVKETTHWNQQATARRYITYQKNIEEGSLQSFFTGKVDIKSLPFSFENQTELIQFVERNGPLGFKKKQKKIEETPKEQQKGDQQEEQKDKNNDQDGDGNQNNDDDEEENDGEKQENNEENGEAAEQQENMEGDDEFDLQKLTAHEKQILNEKSRPIRQYLIDNVIPQITQGLLEICKDTPQDPISFLIKFLQNKQVLKNKK